MGKKKRGFSQRKKKGQIIIIKQPMLEEKNFFITFFPFIKDRIHEFSLHTGN
uniref:Uncharacterized protein n=1 Tax=Arundo donax TaxID=35708 RepID=A0A0A9H7T6_ARUDO